MKFNIIRNQDYAEYGVSNYEYMGQLEGVGCGWRFEARNSEGETRYLPVLWSEDTPEKYAEDHNLYSKAGEGFTLTGTVIFCGYAMLAYGADESEFRVYPMSYEDAVRMERIK